MATSNAMLDRHRVWVRKPNHIPNAELSFRKFVENGAKNFHFRGGLQNYEANSWIVSVHYYDAQGDLFRMTTMPVERHEAFRITEVLRKRKPHTKRNRGATLSIKKDGKHYEIYTHYVVGVRVEPTLRGKERGEKSFNWGDTLDIPDMNVDRAIYDSVILGL